MSLHVKTNMHALYGQRNLDKSQNSLSTALQRLSSGMRINSSKDDAAGLAVVSRMSYQISGLTAARRNANDGVSISQTAEAALSTAGEMLRRIRELAVQSANATNSDIDRQSLNQEVTQIKLELERIGRDTEFNGRKLLDGSFSNQYFQIGSEAAQLSIVSLSDSRPISIGAQFTGEVKEMSFAGGIPATGNEYSFDINGVRVSVKQTGGAADYGNLKDAINAVSHMTNVKAEFKTPGAPGTGLVLTGPSFDIGNFWAKDPAGNYVAGNMPSVTGQLIGALPAPPMDNGNAGTNGIGTQILSVYGYLGNENINIQAGTTARDIAQTINDISHTTGVKASARTVAYLSELGGEGFVGFKLFGSNSAEINISAEITNKDDLTALASAINEYSDSTGITAELSVDKASIKLVSENGDDIVIGDFYSSNATNQTIVVKGPTSIGDFVESGVQSPGASVMLDGSNSTIDSTRIGGRVSFHSDLGFRVETNEAAMPGTLLADNVVLSDLLPVADIDISTYESAVTTIITIDGALTAINANRASLGAIQNRFEAAVANLEAVTENLSSARSRIRDADYAAETTDYATAQILREAGIAMLAQANAIPQNVLTLLQG